MAIRSSKKWFFLLFRIHTISLIFIFFEVLYSIYQHGINIQFYNITDLVLLTLTLFLNLDAYHIETRKKLDFISVNISLHIAFKTSKIQLFYYTFIWNDTVTIRVCIQIRKIRESEIMSFHGYIIIFKNFLRQSKIFLGKRTSHIEPERWSHISFTDVGGCSN